MKLLPALAALLLSGCMLDSQRFTRHPDGSYSMRVRTITVGMNASVAGMRSDWQTEDAIYGDSVSNLNAVVETRIIEAAVEGAVRAALKP